jgi:hypothetical protein
MKKLQRQGLEIVSLPFELTLHMFRMVMNKTEFLDLSCKVVEMGHLLLSLQWMRSKAE